MANTSKQLFGIPTKKAQEVVSVSYVKAVIAQAGLNTKTYEWDDGLDLDMGSRKKDPLDGEYPNIWVNLQIKSISRWEERDGLIDFWLDRKSYDDYRSVFSPTNQYLILYTMNYSRSTWLAHQQDKDKDYTLFNRQAYYLKLTTLPPIKKFKNGKDRAGITLRVPQTNRFTAASARKIYFDAIDRARQERIARGGVSDD